MIGYRVDDRSLEAAGFLALAGQIWPGDHDREKTPTLLCFGA